MFSSGHSTPLVLTPRQAHPWFTCGELHTFRGRRPLDLLLLPLQIWQRLFKLLRYWPTSTNNVKRTCRSLHSRELRAPTAVGMGRQGNSINTQGTMRYYHALPTSAIANSNRLFPTATHSDRIDDHAGFTVVSPWRTKRISASCFGSEEINAGS